MHIYNITFNIADEVHLKILNWIKEIYIPKMLATAKFQEALMSRVLVKEQMGGITYSIQFKAESLAAIKRYYREDEPEMMDLLTKFKGQLVFFATEMEIVHTQ